MTMMTRQDYTSTSRIAPRASCETDDVSDCRLSRPTGRLLEGSPEGLREPPEASYRSLGGSRPRPWKASTIPPGTLRELLPTDPRRPPRDATGAPPEAVFYGNLPEVCRRAPGEP